MTQRIINEINLILRGDGYLGEFHKDPQYDRWNYMIADEEGVSASGYLTGNELVSSRPIELAQRLAGLIPKQSIVNPEPLSVASGAAQLDLERRSRASLGAEEIENRFGFHKATIEGANATLPVHRDVRILFRRFAEALDEQLVDGRAKDLFWTHLETASMWAHKAIAEQAPVVGE